MTGLQLVELWLASDAWTRLETYARRLGISPAVALTRIIDELPQGDAPTAECAGCHRRFQVARKPVNGVRHWCQACRDLRLDAAERQAAYLERKRARANSNGARP